MQCFDISDQSLLETLNSAFGGCGGVVMLMSTRSELSNSKSCTCKCSNGTLSEEDTNYLKDGQNSPNCSSNLLSCSTIFVYRCEGGVLISTEKDFKKRKKKDRAGLVNAVNLITNRSDIYSRGKTQPY